MKKTVLFMTFFTLLCACQKEVPKEMTLEDRQNIAEEIRQFQYNWLNSMEVFNNETINVFLSGMVPGDDEVWMGNPAMWLNELTFYPNNEVINESWQPEIENRSSTTFKIEKDYVAVVSPEYAVYVAIGTFAVTDAQGNNTGDIPMSGTSVMLKKNNQWKVLHWHNSWQQD
jgi:hypothetical protein